MLIYLIFMKHSLLFLFLEIILSFEHFIDQKKE